MTDPLDRLKKRLAGAGKLPRLLVAAMVLGLTVCSKKTASIAGAIETRTCGDVTAAWFPDRVELRSGSDAPVSFKPRGELFDSDRSFDIFSADCRFVALLQDHYGPYHVVPTARLTAAPIVVTAGKGSVLSDQAWLPSGELEFFASCCGGVEVYRTKLGSAPERVFFAAEAPHGIQRTDGGYAINR